MNKKAIAQVVTVVFLLIVATVSVGTFTGFFQTMITDLQTKSDERKDADVLDINGITVINSSSSRIYIHNRANTYAIINTIKVNKTTCNLEVSDVAKADSVTEIELDSCGGYQDYARVEVVVSSDFGVSSEEFKIY